MVRWNAGAIDGKLIFGELSRMYQRCLFARIVILRLCFGMTNPFTSFSFLRPLPTSTWDSTPYCATTFTVKYTFWLTTALST